MSRRRESPSPGRDQPSPGPPPPPPPPPIIRKLPPGGAIFGFKPARVRRDKTPQESISLFWKNFNARFSGVPWTILPDDIVAKRASAVYPKGVAPGESALASYDAAAEACRAKVRMISKECRRINQKYRDHHFDIDLYGRDPRFCLDGLVMKNSALKPRGSARVHEIFDDPRFYVDGATAGDIKQGRDGDCWFLAAVTAITNKPELVRKICVERDEEVGVYGFVFYRDGEWISTVVDDRLYLTMSDYNDRSNERSVWEDRNIGDTEEEYRKIFQTGSKALYFAQCRDENETWLPLLEKAYAKVHGDYNAIDGGLVGEGIEDITGGVTTEFYAPDILDKTKFWNELLKVNDEFLFGCHTGTKSGGFSETRHGILERHAYSILGAVEVKGLKLVKLRNPWGNSEWTGAWSDGSKEWTPEWMTILKHRFDDDGIFWISFQDLMRKYQIFSRTRLFGPEWSRAIQWTYVEVPWSIDYSSAKFKFTLTEATRCVIVLSQLDTRYFRGLEGQYRYELQFRLHEEGKKEFIVRSQSNYSTRRSVSTELDLDKGSYDVLLKITAFRDHAMPSQETVVRNLCSDEREKLLQIGLSYDLAYAKAQFKPPEPEEESDVIIPPRQNGRPGRQPQYVRENSQKWRDDFGRPIPIRKRRTRTMEIVIEGKAKDAAVNGKEKNQEAGADASTGEQEPGKPNGTNTEAKDKHAAVTEPVISAAGGAGSEAPPAAEIVPSNPEIPLSNPDEALADSSGQISGENSHPDNAAGARQKDNDKVAEDSHGPKIPVVRDHDCPPHPIPTPVRRADSTVRFDDGTDNDESASEVDAARSRPVYRRGPRGRLGQHFAPGLPPGLRRNYTMESEMDDGEDYSSDEEYYSEDGRVIQPMPPRPFPSGPFHPEPFPPPPGNRAHFNQQNRPIIIERVNNRSPYSSDDDYGPPDEFTRDPWNAVCVVSLRVLTQKGKASIEVVRPKKTANDGKQGLAMGNEVQRDIDAVAVDEAKEGPAAEKFDGKGPAAVAQEGRAEELSKKGDEQDGKEQKEGHEDGAKQEEEEAVVAPTEGKAGDDAKQGAQTVKEKERELDRQVAEAVQDGIETSGQHATAIETKDKGL